MNIWNDDDKLLMKEWIKENRDTFISSEKHHPELSALFPNKTPRQIYDQLWRLRTKLNLPRFNPQKIREEKGGRTSRQMPMLGQWNHKEIERLKDWINRNPGIIPSTRIPPSLGMKMAFTRRSAAAIYKKWKLYRDSIVDDHGVVMSSLSKKFAAVVAAVRREDEATQEPTARRNGFDIVKILNAAFEKAIQCYEIDKKEHERLKSENQELKSLLVKLTGVREAVENFQKTEFPKR